MLAPLVSWKHGRPLLVMAASGLMVLEVVMLAIHATGMDAGPAVTNLARIAMTATVLWNAGARGPSGPRARRPAAVGADLYLIPVARPFPAPGEGLAADHAGLLRQVAFVGGAAEIDVFASHEDLKASLYVHVKL